MTLVARAEELDTRWIGAFDGNALDAHLWLPPDWRVRADAAELSAQDGLWRAAGAHFAGGIQL